MFQQEEEEDEEEEEEETKVRFACIDLIELNFWQMKKRSVSTWRHDGELSLFCW